MLLPGPDDPIAVSDPLDRLRFPIDEWALTEAEYSSDNLGVTETLFAVGNGYLGLRGNVAAQEHLPGKPAPDTFAYAAEQLGVPRERAVVFEDALSGVEAGRAGNFGLVVGVDRGVGAERLRESGADLVVADLAELAE